MTIYRECGLGDGQGQEDAVRVRRSRQVVRREGLEPAENLRVVLYGRKAPSSGPSHLRSPTSRAWKRSTHLFEQTAFRQV
jgi:hypothetical protein